MCVCVCVCVCEAGSAVLTSQLCRSIQVGGEEQGGGHDEAGKEPARLLHSLREGPASPRPAGQGGTGHHH